MKRLNNDLIEFESHGKKVAVFSFTGLIKFILSREMVKDVIVDYDDNHKIFTTYLKFKSGKIAALITSKEDALKLVNNFRVKAMNGTEPQFEVIAQKKLLFELLKRPDVAGMLKLWELEKQVSTH